MTKPLMKYVPQKYYSSIRDFYIDRSTCYETATEARRAAKSVKGGKVMIVVEKFTRALEVNVSRSIKTNWKKQK